MKRYLFILVTIMLLCTPVSVASPSKVSEYKAKALFLGALLKYTKFPDSEKYSIAVIGKNPFNGHLKKLESRKINRKKVSVTFFNTAPKKIDGYHIVFIAKSEKVKQAKILKTVSSDTLTVADNRWFLASGGVVNLSLKKKGIRWEVNYEALKDKKYQISSKVLRIALNAKDKNSFIINKLSPSESKLGNSKNANRATLQL